jgi:hypothetical protein
MDLRRSPSQPAGGALRRGARRGAENRERPGPVCLGAIQPRTPSPEDVLRGAVRAPPAGGTSPRERRRHAMARRSAKRRRAGTGVRGSAVGKMGAFTVSDDG